MTDLGGLTITKVCAVEARDVPFSVGFVPPWSPSQTITTRDYIIVRIETDAGIFGLSMDGEYTPYGIPATADQVERLVAPYLVGRRVADMEAHSAFLHSIGHMGRFFFVAVALWDILGKAKETPMAKLFGAHQDRVPLYSTGSTYPERGPEWHGAFFDRALELGFLGVNFR